MPSSVAHLLTADRTEIERLLRLRPDVVLPPVPRDLRELANRLDDPRSVAAVLHSAELPVLHVAEALQALGGTARRLDLVALLDGADAGRASLTDVDRSLRWLADRAVVRLTGDDEACTVEGSDALTACFPWPLGLGRFAAELHSIQTAETLRHLLARLGLPRQGNKAAALAAVVDLLRDPAAVRALAADAPPDVASWLAECSAAPQGSAPDDWDVDDDDLERGSVGTLYDPVAYRRDRKAARWAAERGLVVPMGWGGDVQMPAEVALALRGPSYRAPFTPVEPAVKTVQVKPADVEREAAASAAAFAEQAAALLDLVARSSLPTLKAGGVGNRELTRLAKLLGTGTSEVRMVLETAAAAGLVKLDSSGVAPSARLAAWREEEPARRFVRLLDTWWRLGGVPSASRHDNRERAPLAGRMDCPRCADARHALLVTLGALPPGTAGDLTSVSARALWTRPLVHAWTSPGELPFAEIWHEAELLGVVARGALTPLGRRLLEERTEDELVELAAVMLPGTSDEAVFGNDLTVLVAGAPSARVTRVLDGVADRESRGGAVVWRITAGSIRRALDEGATADGLERELLAVARSGLPQPLSYLLQDVGRRHGSVRVRDVASCLRSEDEALLAQVAADRSLRRLGLRVLAPTVLVSAADARTTIEALRAAGYLPVVEDADGTVVVSGQRPRAAARGDGRASTRPPAQRSRATGAQAPAVEDHNHATTPNGTTAPNGATRPKQPAAPDLATLAAALVRAGDPGRRQPASLSEARVRQLAPALPDAQVRLLGHALDAGQDVVIDYLSGAGALTRRQIGSMTLVGGTLQAWCHLRQDERFFTVSRIESVERAPSGA